MNFCLSDLVPPLRWSDAVRMRELRDLGDDAGLPDAWWRTLPIERVLAATDARRLGALLAELALAHWPAAAVGDILPALYVLDPDDADEPHVAIALDRAGSWPGLLALTGHDLRDQPFIQALPVLTTLFGAVFGRLTTTASRTTRPKATALPPHQAAIDAAPPRNVPTSAAAATPPPETPKPEPTGTGTGTHETPAEQPNRKTPEIPETPRQGGKPAATKADPEPDTKAGAPETATRSGAAKPKTPPVSGIDAPEPGQTEIPSPRAATESRRAGHPTPGPANDDQKPAARPLPGDDALMPQRHGPDRDAQEPQIAGRPAAKTTKPESAEQFTGLRSLGDEAAGPQDTHDGPRDREAQEHTRLDAPERPHERPHPGHDGHDDHDAKPSSPPDAAVRPAAAHLDLPGPGTQSPEGRHTPSPAEAGKPGMLGSLPESPDGRRAPNPPKDEPAPAGATSEEPAGATAKSPIEAGPDASAGTAPDGPAGTTPKHPAATAPAGPIEAGPENPGTAPDGLPGTDLRHPAKTAPASPTETGPDASAGAAPDGPAGTTPKHPAKTAPAGLIAAGPERSAGTTPDGPAGTDPRHPAKPAPAGLIAAGPERSAGTTPDGPAGTDPRHPAKTVPDSSTETGPDASAGTASDGPAGTDPKHPAKTAPDGPIGAGPERSAGTAPDGSAGTDSKHPAKAAPGGLIGTGPGGSAGAFPKGSAGEAPAGPVGAGAVGAVGSAGSGAGGSFMDEGGEPGGVGPASGPGDLFVAPPGRAVPPAPYPFEARSAGVGSDGPDLSSGSASAPVGGAVKGGGPAGGGADAGGAPGSLADLIDAAFADLDDETWAVAQNRVFTDDPSEIEQLAKLFAVPRERMTAHEAELRARLAAWLASPEAAPYREHVDEMIRVLGVAAPKARLVAAADWHRRELRSLDVPAWQFVLATLPGYHVAGDWLVVGDLAELHERTRGLIVNAERPPTVTRALELVSSLGIHPEVAKEWLDNVPQLRIQTPGEGDRPSAPSAPSAPPETGGSGPSGSSQAGREAFGAPVAPGAAPSGAVAPGVVASGVAASGAPAPGVSSGAAAPGAAPGGAPGFAAPGAAPSGVAASGVAAPGVAGLGNAGAGSAGAAGQGVEGDGPGHRPSGLKDVALTRRCFQQPDGRWWLRVDVTEEHLAGAECALPSGFAAYLGLSPGESRTVVSASGELALHWQARPVVESMGRLLHDVGAAPGSHLFITLADETTLRARHLPGIPDTTGDEITRVLRLVGYTAPGGTMDQAIRVIGTRVGMKAPVSADDLVNRLRERGDRDLLALLT
jgi:hypothetical protein